MGWMLSDAFLARELELVIQFYYGQTWTLKLFKNDFNPLPGTTVDDLEECDFPGYEPASFPSDDMPLGAITDHVVYSLLPYALNFTADASGFSEQIAYGYWIMDFDDNLLLAERFATPITVHPTDTFSVQPKISNKTCQE